MPDAAGFQPFKSSPLTDLPAPFGGITLEERRFLGKVIVRGEPDDEAFTQAVTGAVGCAPPLEPNTTATSAGVPARTVFWLGPNEWMIHCAEDTQYALVADLREVLKGRHAAVVDVSDYYVLMRLSGEKTLEVLGKGTPLDLHPRSFQVGRCAQTHFGHATVLLHRVEDNVMDLQVRWSFAEYVWSFIVDGTRGYSAAPG